MGQFIDLYECNWFPVVAFKGKDGSYSSPLRTLFMQEMIKRGVLFQGTLTPCFSHTEDDMNILAGAFEESLDVYKAALVEGWEKHLVGKECKPVFRKYL